MKFLILCENSNGSWPYLHYRGLGAFELKKRIRSHGHEATILEWFTHWTHADLLDVARVYFKDTDQPVLAISTPFDSNDLISLRPFILKIRQEYPNVKVIHGGSRTYQKSMSDLVDMFFLGRSMEVFDAWMRGRDLTPYIIRRDPSLVLLNNNFNQVIDNPVVPDIDIEDDCISNRDILGFEIGVGCKFNCTFCNYELRNAKITKFLDPKELHHYFEVAYKKYGVTNFFASDDTINESDEKLEIILEAMQGLDYSPKITAFARLDLFSKRRQQLDLIEKIQFSALFFGIESFNPEVSKSMRKRTGLVDNFATLKEIKERCPDTYTIGSLIIGLMGDSEQSIRESIKKVVDEKLLWGLQLYQLGLLGASTETDTYFLSELDKDPEKHGYKKIIPIEPTHVNKETTAMFWESDWTDLDKALVLCDSLYKEHQDNILFMNHYEYAGFKALGLIKPGVPVKFHLLRHSAHTISDQLKQVYIQKKKAYIGVGSHKSNTSGL